MISEDISATLTRQLSSILEDCRRIEPALQAYQEEAAEIRRSRASISSSVTRAGKGHRVAGHEHKHGLSINELPDEPRARHSVPPSLSRAQSISYTQFVMHRASLT
jgi:hypothetical protein